MGFGFFGGGNDSTTSTTNQTKTGSGVVQDNAGSITQVTGDNISVIDAGIIDKGFDLANNYGNASNDLINKSFNLVDDTLAMSYDFFGAMAKSLATNEQNALNQIETIQSDSNSFIADYSKNSSERLIDNLMNYAGVAVLIGGGIWLFKGLK